MKELSFEDFLKTASAQSLGKFGEFLFLRYCQLKGIPCVGRHKGGVDFYVENKFSIDVKAVRHISVPSRHSFRRHNIEKQLPGVIYAYIIFWNDSVELRVEEKDLRFGDYDCSLENQFVSATWDKFDKKSVKFIDSTHGESASRLKRELTTWISENLGVRARVIQRKSTAKLGDRKGGWGADNFYTKPPHNHEIVVLLGIANGLVSFIHSYPTAEYANIKVRPKPVGTNRKEILCYDVGELSDRYKFKDVDDFKISVRQRFNL